MLSRFWQLIEPKARWRFLLLALVVGLGGLVELLGIATVAEMVRLVANGGEAGQGHLSLLFKLFDVETTRQRLNHGLAISIVILAGVQGYSALRSYLRSQFVWLQEKEISTRLLSVTLQRPYLWFLTRNSSELLHLIVTGNLTQMLINGVLQVLGQLSVAATLLITLVWVDPKVALIGGLFVTVAYTLVRLATKEMLTLKGSEAHKANIERRRLASEALTGIRFVKSTGRENFFLKRFDNLSQKAAEGMVYQAIYVDVVRAFLEWVCFAGILCLSVGLVLQEKSFDDLLARLTLYTMASYRIIPAIHELFGLWAKLRFNAHYITDIEELLEGSRLEDSYQVEKLKGTKSKGPFISFQDVRFTYPQGEREILRGLNLSISHHEWVGIVGTTGAGKTTILDLISGLCSPTSGQVVIGESLLTPEVTRDWQRRIGTVPQEVILLDDTLLHNIAFGLETSDIDLARAHQVCLAAGLGSFLETLPQGLDTPVRERGIRLSGGERQRVGLARALYQQPDLLLLDEATSALDQATEARIVETLRGLARNCTLVTVAHRLSSVKPCDRILLIDQGQVIAEGPYKELLEKSPIFRDMALVGG